MFTIPRRFEDAHLSDWEPDTAIRMIGESYVRNFVDLYNQGKAPCFFGVAGSGKSRAAAAIGNTLRAVTVPPIRVYWFPASEAINRLLDYRDLRLTARYDELWDALTSKSLLVVDDITTVRNSPRVMEYFWMVADHRYSNLLPTIYTGNFKADAATLWKTIADWFGDPFARRLQETSRGLTGIL